MKRLFGLGAAMLVIGLGAAGCSHTEEGVKQDADNMKPAIQQASENVEDATKHAAKNADAALLVTPKVKDAIIADKELNDPRNVINVNSADNVVHLKGHVASKQLKQHATDVASKALSQMNATDKLSNELTVQ